MLSYWNMSKLRAYCLPSAYHNTNSEVPINTEYVPLPFFLKCRDSQTNYFQVSIVVKYLIASATQLTFDCNKIWIVSELFYLEMFKP